MRILLALLGIAVSFIVKYDNRSDKSKPLSFTFWAKDNWPELSVSLIAMTMLLILFRDATFNQIPTIQGIPWLASLPMDEVAAALAGWLNTTLFYALFKTKKK